MTIAKLICVLACLIPAAVVAQDAKAPQEAKPRLLISKDLPNIPGKEAVMLLVEYPPSNSDAIHRHSAHVLIYVLEGSIVIQVRGGKETTLTPGQTFYEGPDDVHTVGRNPSNTATAKFLVFYVKDKGAPLTVASN